jgi:succinate dehydrogenase/fumarate reductase flavoprotein subunit
MATPDIEGSARDALHDRVNRDVLYYPPGDKAREAHDKIRAETERLAHVYIDLCPPSRELSLALTKLIDEAMAHANAAVARNHDRL